MWLAKRGRWNPIRTSNTTQKESIMNKQAAVETHTSPQEDVAAPEIDVETVYAHIDALMSWANMHVAPLGEDACKAMADADKLEAKLTEAQLALQDISSMMDAIDAALSIARNRRLALSNLFGYECHPVASAGQRRPEYLVELRRRWKLVDDYCEIPF